jgi:hypothetical protein
LRAESGPRAISWPTIVRWPTAGRKEVMEVLVVPSQILEQRRSSVARGFPSDSLNVAPRDADISKLTVIQAVQLTKTLIISPPDPKHSNQASDKIHGCLLSSVAVFAPNCLFSIQMKTTGHKEEGLLLRYSYSPSA